VRLNIRLAGVTHGVSYRSGRGERNILL